MSKKLFAYVREQNGGCDYTIGCGMSIQYIHADSLEEAIEKIIDLPTNWQEELRKDIESDGDVDGWFKDYLADSGLSDVMPGDFQLSNCYLLEVNQEVAMQSILKKKYNEALKFKAELLKEKQEKSERDEFERLKKKFEK